MLIRVDAIGINRAEALFRAGTYFEQPVLPGSRIGYEAAGVVEAVGAGVEGLVPGDEIGTTAGFSMRHYGVYAERVVVPAGSVLRRQVDAVTGAAVWLTHQTAYGGMVERAGLRPDDTVVITAASSGVGLAAIQIANHLGATPVAVTRGEAKRERLLQAGAAHVVTTESEDLVKRVREITGGRGAEIVFDSIGGPGLHQLAEAVATGGSLVVYGSLALEPTPLPMNWDSSIAVYGYSNGDYLVNDEERLRRAESFINAGLRIGTLTPVIDQVYADLTDIAEAHRRMESNEHIGKIVVQVRH
ncbi:zinc-dependent alcohol dehydrogenase family protein [Amycolatopsis taiwanensis]|uniref:NADPH:quinone reductase n=1 Tax=Amycolatopsis taiwanensis TaxID=342230 RepID=A0A9W6R099_9PSEU|nr:zinc-dependent alcohol dehydrogenase family protein [Amycolatopsis taiwanensis]GLY65170.1 NADPH:quinone reductase [Amycolatopsis taiwanensis]